MNNPEGNLFLKNIKVFSLLILNVVGNTYILSSTTSLPPLADDSLSVQVHSGDLS